MKCFNHPEKSAVGICKSCGKGLCPDCAKELRFGLACKDSCIDRVNTINAILDTSQKVRQTANRELKSAGLSGVIIGISFLIFSYFAFNELNQSFLPYMLGTIGSVMLVFGILRLSKKRAYPEG